MFQVTWKSMWEKNKWELKNLSWDSFETVFEEQLFILLHFYRLLLGVEGEVHWPQD